MFLEGLLLILPQVVCAAGWSSQTVFFTTSVIIFCHRTESKPVAQPTAQREQCVGTLHLVRIVKASHHVRQRRTVASSGFRGAYF